MHLVHNVSHHAQRVMLVAVLLVSWGTFWTRWRRNLVQHVPKSVWNVCRLGIAPNVCLGIIMIQRLILAWLAKMSNQAVQLVTALNASLANYKSGTFWMSLTSHVPYVHPKYPTVSTVFQIQTASYANTVTLLLHPIQHAQFAHPSIRIANIAWTHQNARTAWNVTTLTVMEHACNAFKDAPRVTTQPHVRYVWESTCYKLTSPVHCAKIK